VNWLRIVSCGNSAESSDSVTLLIGRLHAYLMQCIGRAGVQILLEQVH